MAYRLPENFDEIRKRPSYINASPEVREAVGEVWIQQQLGRYNLKDPSKMRAQLEAIVYPERQKAPQESWLSKEWKEFAPPLREYPRRMGEFAGRLGNISSYPQELIHRFRTRSTAEPEAGASELWDIVKQETGETAKGAVKDVLGIPRVRPEYKMLEDPTNIYLGAKILRTYGPRLIKKFMPTFYESGKETIKKVGAKPASKAIEETPSLRGGMEPVGVGVERAPISEIPGRVVGEAPIPGKVPPLRTVGQPKPDLPIFGEFWKEGDFPLKKAGLQRKLQQAYNEAIKKVGPQFPKEEAQELATFMVKNPADRITILLQKGTNLETPLSKVIKERWVQQYHPETTLRDFINARLFKGGMRANPVVDVTNLTNFQVTPKGVAIPRTRVKMERPLQQPTTPIESTIIKEATPIVEEINLTSPKAFQEYLKKAIDLEKF